MTRALLGMVFMMLMMVRMGDPERNSRVIHATRKQEAAFSNAKTRQ